MTITHDTTVEEYEAWLSTYPSISELKKATNKLFKLAYSTMGTIKKLIKKISTKHRSCLAGRKASAPVYPEVWRKMFQAWRANISTELARTQRHIQRLDIFEKIGEQKWGESVYRERHNRLADKVEQELAMETLFQEALNGLIKK
jgi:hypothetical protein